MQIKNFKQIVQDFAVSAQSAASVILDFSVGSIYLSIAEAAAGMGLWFQGMILQVLSLTRASTSSGDDLDSWYADFNFPRLTGSFAAGSVTFGRFTTTAAATIPIGALVQTSDGTQKYSVVADATNAYYSSSANGYVIPVGVVSINVPVQALTVGTVGNVTAGLVNTLATTIVGVDYVTNPSSMTGGVTKESDFNYRSRFPLYLIGLRQGTPLALKAAIVNLQLGLTCKVIEGSYPNGTLAPGVVSVVVDDGTGNPSSSIIAQCGSAIANARAGGINAYVFAPTISYVAVGLAVTAASGYDFNTVKGAVGIALSNYLNALAIGQPLYYTDVAAIARNAHPGVLRIGSILVNGGTSDVSVLPGQIIKPSSIAVG